MRIKETILDLLSRKQSITAREITSRCKASRQGVNFAIRQLIKEGKIVKMGSTRGAFYATPEQARTLKTKIKKRLLNKSLKEHEVLEKMANQSPLFSMLAENVRSIFEYALSEMLNNAIEHSNSKFVEVSVKEEKSSVSFVVDDFGIGVFKNIMEKRNLNSELEAIQDLLKGKTTTQPQAHSGEGIFFTSKIADVFILESFGYRLRVDNFIDDIFIEPLKPSKRGTRVIFSINERSKKHLSDIFRAYQASSHEIGFNKTEIKVRLFTMGTIYISRSQARRILAGLESFKSITLDFDKVPTIGQAFADEVFRVFATKHPEIQIQAINANEAVQFMIDRVESDKTLEEKTGKLSLCR